MKKEKGSSLQGKSLISFLRMIQTAIPQRSLEAIDSDGNIIIADTIVYKKSEEFLTADGNVKITDKEGNLLLSKKFK